MILPFIDRYTDAGLFVLRAGIGLSMALGHGWGKITGGPEFWANHGQRAAVVGLDFLPVFWGFMSAFAEFACALLVVLGLFFHPALILLILNMAMAVTWHLASGQGSPVHALEFGIVWIALFLIGPGRFSIDAYFSRPPRRRLY